MIKSQIFTTDTNKLVTILESLVGDNKYSYRGPMNDYDSNFISSDSQWVVNKENETGQYLLFRTTSALSSNFMDSFKAIINILEENKISMSISFKGYVQWGLIISLLIFLTFCFFSIKEGNPLFVLYFILLGIGGLFTQKDKRKFRKSIISTFLNNEK